MKNKKCCFLFTIVVFVGSVVMVNGQKLKPGPQDLSFFSSVDETDQPYAVYIPNGFDESKKYPLVVFLHGAMSNHRLGLRRAFGQGNIQGEDFITPGFVPVETDLEVTRYFPVLKEVDCIVAAPYARGTAGYQGIPEEDVYEMIDDLKSRFPIDEDRLYLTGLSMGGGGTLWLGLTRPDMWAAIAPCCPAPPTGTTDLACNALNIPVHLFIGGQDFLYQTAQEWKTLFESNRIQYDYVEYPGIGHNSWEYAYKDGFIFDWFSQFKRDLFPHQITFKTQWYKYNKAYWVTIDRLNPGTPASVRAAFTGENAIDITTSEVGAITLHLAGHSLFNPNRGVNVTLDGRMFTIKTPDAVSFSLRDGEWANRKYTPNLYSKQPSAEGPINAAISSNHIYIYGTAGDPTQEELQARQAQADLAANWSVDRGMMGRVMVFPRVLSDQQIRQSDLDISNMILFGTRETNAFIEKYADRLPMHLNPDSEGYGLVYVYPLNDHYVLINSGLPWWTPPEESGPGGFAFMSSVTNVLANFQDFIFFQNSPDHVISQGYFDHEWQIPEEEAAKIKVSGVVALKE
ncbi:phospholipase [bacterium]|nr:phospholipase [bacterium]RQV98053.1 MAG: phospholipase [bacterium]